MSSVDPNVSNPVSTFGYSAENGDQPRVQSLSKFDHDLFNEDDNIVEKVIRVKRTGAFNRNEKWKISENDKVVFVVEGDKVSKKEREFLRGIDGINFLIAQAKIGIKSLNKLRGELKKAMTKTSTK